MVIRSLVFHTSQSYGIFIAFSTSLFSSHSPTTCIPSSLSHLKRHYNMGGLVDQVNSGHKYASSAAAPFLPSAAAVAVAVAGASVSYLSSAPSLSPTKKRAHISTLEAFLGKSYIIALHTELDELGVEEIKDLKHLNNPEINMMAAKLKTVPARMFVDKLTKLKEKE